MKRKSRNIYLCSPKRVEGVTSLPMIQFALIKDSIDYKDSDTLIFTSKQAIYYTQELDKNWIKYPVITIGSATKKVAISFGANVIYQPKNYYGEELAKGVLRHFKDRNLLYIRPKVISFDSKSYLESHGIWIKEEIIYETTCITHHNKELEQNSIIIFTSPSTIYCFFKSFKWRDDLTAVVIGDSTLKKLPLNVNAIVADTPTISSCIKKAKTL